MNTRTHAEMANFIWSICNLLRGPYKRNEYRKVILPLTVLRRFDCVLAETKEAVLAAEEGYTGDSANVRGELLEKAAGRPFSNTSRLDFARLLDDPNQIGQNLSRYTNTFSPNVREIMERFGFEEHIARMDERNLLFQVVQPSPTSTSRRSASTTCRWGTCLRSSSASVPSRRTRRPGSTSHRAR